MAAIERLITADDELRLVPQVMFEFWAIANRPVANNGLGLTIEQAETELTQFRLLFPPLRDERGILEPWQSLVAVHRVQGKATHDARLVVAMQRHGLTHILTFNVPDFKRKPGIEVFDPHAIADPRADQKTLGIWQCPKRELAAFWRWPGSESEMAAWNIRGMASGKENAASLRRLPCRE